MTEIYGKTKDKKDTIEEMRKATKTLIDNGIDMIVCEYFRNIEEMEWAIEHALSYGKPIAATICAGPNGDADGVPLAECAIRMAKAGAQIIGLNCLYDPFMMLECMKIMKTALDGKGLKPFLMTQPLGFRTPDAGDYGWVDLPEFPYAVEPRQITRIEAMKYARQAYDLGVRYIGGCCGFESYHIRAMAEELRNERGKLPEASKKSEFSRNLFMAAKRYEANPISFKDKHLMSYWMNLKPKSGLSNASNGSLKE